MNNVRASILSAELVKEVVSELNRLIAIYIALGHVEDAAHLEEIVLKVKGEAK